MQKNRATVGELVRHRFERSRKRLEAAMAFLDDEWYDGATTDAYYAIFHAMNAAQLLTGAPVALRHGGVVRSFNKNYIGTGIVPADFGARIWSAMQAWQGSEYQDFFEISEEDASQHVETARELLDIIEPYCLARLEEEKHAPEPKDEGSHHLTQQ